MNRSRWIIVAVVVLAAVAGGWWWKSRSVDGAPKYRTADLDRGTVESVVSATGTIRPVVQVQVGSQVSGTVDKLYADYNSKVRTGQVICQLEPSSFRARELQAEAAVTRAEASVTDGQRALKRAQELFDKQYSSQADLDAAVVALQQRQADLKQARAALDAAQVDLQHTTIRAPIDGVVISRSVDLGQTVAASLQAPQLFVIANDLTQMQVETRIDEADIGQIRAGLPVSFSVDAFPDRDFSGQVAQVRLEPIDVQGVVTYTTVIRTSNPDLRLRPGMTANVTVKIERHEDVFRVPNAALRFRPQAAGGNGAMAAGMGRGGAGGGGGRGAGEAQAAQRTGDGGGPGGMAGGGRGREGAAPGDSTGGRGGAAGSGHRGGRHGDGAGAAGGRAGRGGSPEGAAGGETPRMAHGLKGAEEQGAAGGDTLSSAPAFRPGVIFLLKDGKPTRTFVMTGITDGAFTEVRGDGIAVGDKVIVGMEVSARATNLAPPPGMGGPGFRGGGGGGRR